MPVASKSSAKPKGDIRQFFGGKGDQPAKIRAVPKPSTTSGPKQNDAIEISDNEEKPASKKSATVKPGASTAKVPKKPTQIIDSEDDEPPPPQRSTGTKRKAAVVSSGDDDEDAPPPPQRKKAAVEAKPAASSSKSTPKKPAATPKDKPTPSAKPKPTPKPKAAARKKKDDDYDMYSASASESSASEDEDDDGDLVPKAAGKKNFVARASKSAPAPAAKKAATTKVDTKPATEEVKPKPNPAAWRAKKAAAPIAHGSKSFPEDAEPDCLAGLTFVFTGELSSFSRDEVIEGAKKFGGRVTGNPSSRTSYVVLGTDAGPKKLEQIKKLGVKTLDEDGFLELIRARKDAPPDAETLKKRKKLEKQYEDAAKEMEKQEAREAKGKGKGVGMAKAKTVDPSSQLWTTKYAPKSLKEVCGNKTTVEKMLLWLQDWQKNAQSSFKKPGKHGMGMHRAILLTGSPGIGKTTSAHLCARMAGYTAVELNASDTRSKKLVEHGMNINNKSLDAWMGGGAEGGNDDVKLTDKSCIIMDEVDGMSAGDRGGVGALNALIKKTKIPIICIANDRNAQKLKPLLHTTFSLKFNKPEATSVRSRIMSIVFKEKMKIPANVVDQLIQGAQSDIRLVLNMLSTWKLSHDSMDFDEGKKMAKLNEKYAIMSPFDVTNKVLGPYLFSPTARETLGDKMEMYFHDHSFVPLFIQENYLKTTPSTLRNYSGPELALKQLELMDKAASSISDGDLVDAMIHGPEQHWALMPLHAVCSTIRPASHVYGSGLGWGAGGVNTLAFPGWLGNNSKTNKLSRQLADVQIRMRLKVTGDKSEIRRAYIPAMYGRLVGPLLGEGGAGAIDNVISYMDEYYLTKEDWETVVELGVGARNGDDVMKKIPSAVKSSFTRKYNASDHPIAFHRGQDLSGGPKKIVAGAAPDIEDAFVVDDDVAGDDEEGGGTKKKKASEVESDKMLKEKKPKAKAGKKSK